MKLLDHVLIAGALPQDILNIIESIRYYSSSRLIVFLSEDNYDVELIGPD